MPASVIALFNEAVDLDARDRATLAGLLLESLGPAQRGAANAARRDALDSLNQPDPMRSTAMSGEGLWRSCSGG